MPRFSYKVRDKQGRIIQTTQEAASAERLIAQLQKEGLLLVSEVQEQVEPSSKAFGRPLHGGIKLDDLIIFSRQLATMLEAGITLLKSLDVLSRQIESRQLLEVVEAVKKDVAGGSTFRDALAKHPRVFSPFWVHIVETGEASGALPVALSQVADYLEAASAMRQKVISSLMYPAILIIIAAVCLVVFAVWIIPTFSRVFDSFDIPLPTLTRLVLGFSNLVKKFFLLGIAAILLMGYLFRQYIQSKKGRLQFDRLLLKIPVLANLFRRIAIERFASGLGTLIESGVPILYGLDIVGSAVGNKVIEQAVAEVRESVREGKGMASPLEQSGVFPPMVVQMVAVGEEIGELGKMLRRISDFYKERIATTLARLTTIIEPTVILFMGVVVGIMVFSMFMPIFQIASVRGGF